jgi:hypothetical protein
MVVPALKYGNDLPARVAAGSTVGVGVVGAVGAVLLDIIHGGGASVVISLILASAAIIVAGLVTFGLMSPAPSNALTATGQLHGSPLFLNLPRNWNQGSVQAIVRDDSSVVCEVLAFRPMESGGTEVLLVKPGGPSWCNLDTLASLIIEVHSKDEQRKQLTAG